MPMPSATQMPANNQNRTMTVNSDQPPTSKWWWIGAMRRTRRRKPRYETTCAITDSVSISGRPGEQEQQEMRARQQREPGHRAADRERAGVAHEDARGRRVPPEEPRARAEHRGRDDRLVERLGANA